MKKILSLLIFTFLFSPLFCYSQGFKGSVLVGGMVNYTSQPAENQQGLDKLENKYFTVQPTVGYFLHDRWAVGPLVSIVQTSTDYPSPAPPSNSPPQFYARNLKSTTWELGAFTRYYFPITQNFFLFGQLNAVYSTTNIEMEVPGFYSAAQLDNSFYSSSVSPNLTYLPLPWLGLEMSLGEMRYQQAKDHEGKNFTVNLNPSALKIGISFYLARNQAAPVE
ncbi:hypothetical protein TH61_06925 [Rufibacter sp. DG15C]|uniref:hypothetical protein n=1 Tax=Rufibacter sp. DG15C TaxID=1379909 RepID=UPI00078C30F9|nr:hypothetical protein [Rufibacter sp. DG15C]AMM50966.1 hypothetical protein TH61_06925 [Rufibacter sp. DG15C]